MQVLIKELQSLGLDVRVLDKDDNEIDLRQNFDDEVVLPVVDNSDYDEAFSNVNDTEDAAGWSVTDEESKDDLFYEDSVSAELSDDFSDDFGDDFSDEEF